MVANLPFAFKAHKAATGQGKKWKIIRTDGLRLKDIKVTEETLKKLKKNIIYALALFGSGQLGATDSENLKTFTVCYPLVMFSLNKIWD